ncbi:hypothetical protein SprV_0802479700 [Sparganum proliferum]
MICVPCTDGEEDCVENLETCQETCGEETIRPETGGYKCDPDSMTCVPCTDGDEDCEEDLQTCQETCGEESECFSSSSVLFTPNITCTGHGRTLQSA